MSNMFRLVKIMSFALIILGIAGSGLTGYILVSLPTLLGPVDQTAAYLSKITLPKIVTVDLSNASQSIKTVADSLPDSVTVLFLNVLDLKAAKAGLYDLSASLSNVEVVTGLNEVENQLHQSAQQIYQVKTYVTYLVAFLFAISVVTVLTGSTFFLLIRSLKKILDSGLSVTNCFPVNFSFTRERLKTPTQSNLTYS